VKWRTEGEGEEEEGKGFEIGSSRWELGAAVTVAWLFCFEAGGRREQSRGGMETELSSRWGSRDLRCERPLYNCDGIKE